MKYFITLVCFLTIFSTLQGQEPTTCPKVGLVLSGGGAKGYAHIGALLELEKNHIYPDIIGGTSMGSIVGGLYASGYTAKQLDSIVYEINFDAALTSTRDRKLTPIFDKSYAEKYLIQLPVKKFKVKIPNAISKGQGSIKILNSTTRHVHDIHNFDSLTTPFFCVATDLVTGNQVILNKGSLAESMMASGAFPALIEPQIINGQILVDGGVVNNFPAKEVKEKGADILIGVDVQRDSMDLDELKSVPRTIQQLTTLISKRSLVDQNSYVDVLMNVDIEKYDVIDFNKKREIIERGQQIARLKMPEILNKIPAHCRTDSTTRMIKNKIHSNDKPFITTIEIEGENKTTEDYIRSKIHLKVPDEISYQRIEKSVDRLFATGDFNQITYTINKDIYGKKIKFKVEESEYNSYIKLGLHYDEVYKTGFLFNYTLKNFIWKDTYLSTDIIVGDKFRANLNFLIDNGTKPSYGFNYAYKVIEFNNPTDQDLLPAGGYDVVDHNAELFISRSFFNRATIGLGIEYDFVRIGESNDLFKYGKAIARNNIGGGKLFFKIDDRDKQYFTKKGILLDAKLKYITESKYEGQEFNPTLFLQTDAAITSPLLSKKLSVTFDIGAGMNFGENELPFGQKFLVGGMNQQKFLNSRELPGFETLEVVTDNYFILGAKLQYNPFKNAYFEGFIYSSHFNDDYLDIKYLDFDEHNSFGVSLGYDSPFGPIKGSYAYAPNDHSGRFYLSLGYWF